MWGPTLPLLNNKVIKYLLLAHKPIPVPNTHSLTYCHLAHILYHTLHFLLSSQHILTGSIPGNTLVLLITQSAHDQLRFMHCMVFSLVCTTLPMLIVLIT